MRVPFFWAAVVLASCGGTGQQTIVEASPAPEAASHRAAPLCFQPTDETSPAKRVRHAELVGICETQAQRGGVKTVHPETPGCLPVALAWHVNAQAAGSTASTNCVQWRGFTHCRHTSSGRRLDYEKVLLLMIFNPEGTRPIHEIESHLWSDYGDFSNATATMLCRAAFLDYPARRHRKAYSLELTRTR